MGGRRLRSVLRRLPDALTEPVGRAAGEVAEAMWADMVTNATGALPVEAIQELRHRVDRNGMTARAGWIGRAATRRWAWLGKIVEVGSKPHTIRAVRSRVLATAAGQVLGREVRHPGTVARPWFQPAFDANKEWGLERIRDAIAETLDAVSAAHPRATEASRD